MLFRFAVLVLSGVSLVAGVSVEKSFYLRQGLSRRQVDPSWPECGQRCLARANLGECENTDNACLCANDDFITGLENCLNRQCNRTDLQVSIDFIDQICTSPHISTRLTATTSARSTATSSASSASSLASTSLSTTTSLSSLSSQSSVVSTVSIANTLSSVTSTASTTGTSFALVTSFASMPAITTGQIPITRPGGLDNASSRLYLPNGAGGLIMSAVAVLGGLVSVFI